jgi:hypothetical protein
MAATTAQSGTGDISAKYVKATLPDDLVLLRGMFKASAVAIFLASFP